MRAVPSSLREASTGLGARRSTTVVKVVLPASISGVVAALIISVSRAIGETMVAAVDSIIEMCPGCGVEEVVMGMAHRGRLNILTSVMRKNFDVLFEQFSENYIPTPSAAMAT